LRRVADAEERVADAEERVDDAELRVDNVDHRVDCAQRAPARPRRAGASPRTEVAEHAIALPLDDLGAAPIHQREIVLAEQVRQMGGVRVEL
jgi:hypothetical protein